MQLQTKVVRSSLFTPAGRAQLAAKQRARWAKAKAGAAPKSETPASSPRNGAKTKREKAPAQRTIGSGLARAARKAGDSQANGRLRSVPTPAAGADGLQMLDPKLCVRSPFNREDFDKAKLDELIADVRERGVLQPGCVRPLPAGRYIIEEGTSSGKPGFFVTPTQLITDCALHGGSKLVREFFRSRAEAEAAMPQWEIIYGERRWLAAKEAGRKYPAIVRDVGDTEAIELQAVENMKREDLNALDEAIKYDQLLKAYEGEGLSRTKAMERIVATTEKADATIYERLTLLKLPEAYHAELRSGKLPASHAALIAKMPSEPDKHQLAKKILQPESYNANEQGILSFRRAKQEADAIEEKAKNLARWQSQADEFEKKGFEVLTPGACKKLMPHGYLHGSDFVRLEDFAVGNKSWDELVKKAKRPNPILARKPDGSPTVVYRRTALVAAAKECGHDLKQQRAASGGSNSFDRDRERRKLQLERRNRVFEMLVPQAVATCENGTPADGFLHLVLLAKLQDGIDHEWLKGFRTRHNIAGKGSDDRQWILEHAKTLNQKELRGLIAELLFHEFAPPSWLDKHHDKLGAVATALGLDIAAAEKAVPKVVMEKPQKAGAKKEVQASGNDGEEDDGKI